MADPAHNLVILHTPGNEDISDWERVKALIESHAPDIAVRIAANNARDTDTERWQARRPSLVFSVCPLWQYRPAGGRVYAGKPMSKMEEHQYLAMAGLPTPKTARLRRDSVLDPAEWGDYVVVKPAHGSFGRDVHLVPTAEAIARYDEIVDPKDGISLVQSFVEHVDPEGRPTTHRVLVLFGTPLYALRSCWSEPRPPLAEIAKPGGLLAANVGAKDRLRELIDDDAMLALASRAAAAVPDAPVLGVDILKETGTGRLIVLELNSAGTVWHLSSETGKRRYTDKFRQSLYEQFGALDIVADRLIEKTRAEAK